MITLYILLGISGLATIISGIVFFIIWKKSRRNFDENWTIGKASDTPLYVFLAFIVATLGIGAGLINLGLTLREEQIQHTNQREQIIYQIENLDDEADKVKLNEQILNYNNWVIEVKSQVDTWGIFSKYYTLDMTNHTIIEVV